MDILKVLNHFNLGSSAISYRDLKVGNINATYVVTTKNGQKFLLQKINSEVFKNPREIMSNIELVLSHLNTQKIFEKQLHLIKTVDKKLYFIDKNGKFWRCYSFIENSITFNNTNDLKIIFQSGNAFGKFQKAFFDFKCEKLHTSIEDFHNIEKRFADLKESAKVAGTRMEHATEEYEYLLSLENECLYLFNMQKNLPLRVTHNDTKCNNVLIDKYSKTALCVIDLDTVMPGFIAHDFGDGARSIASSVGEDERDLSKINFEIEKFLYFSKGFLFEIKDYLTPQEKQSLYSSIKIITCELSVRFLTDYFMRDLYFKIDYPEHNLIRAKNQIALLKDVIKKQADIDNVISACLI